MSERIRAARVAAITGLTLRTVQALTAAGSIPGAAKLGGSWTYDEGAVRRWVRAKEAEAVRARAGQRRPGIATGAAKRSGRGSQSADASIEKAYEQALRL